jgi:hypothetical protein
MVRIPARSIWLQSAVVLAVIVGIIAGDISVASARVAANHKRAELRKLHRAEAAYVAQVDAISHDLFADVQPVQNALDQLDASRPQYVDGARDAVVNSHTSAAITKLGTRLAQLRPTKTLISQHTAMRTALSDITKNLATLEKGKKAKDASDMLDEPYAGAAVNLSIAEDDWQKTLLAMDTLTHRVQAPSPGATGSARPKSALPASKASWIFSADAACVSASRAMFALKDPGDSASLPALAKFEDRYAAIVGKVNTDLRKIPMPTADRAYLQRTVFKSLKANDGLAEAAREAARGFRTRDINLLMQSDSQNHLALKAMAPLSKNMNTYGAEFCGWFFNPNNKNDTRNTGGTGGGSVSA